MTQDEIVKMAQEAGIGWWLDDGKLERFAALVREATLEQNNLTWVANCQHLVQAEREACARVCEEPGWNAANWCAKAIRARGEK